jgi:hypothetical protein
MRIPPVLLGIRLVAVLVLAWAFATVTPLPAGGVLLAVGYDERIRFAACTWLCREARG